MARAKIEIKIKRVSTGFKKVFVVAVIDHFIAFDYWRYNV